MPVAWGVYSSESRLLSGVDGVQPISRRRLEPSEILSSENFVAVGNLAFGPVYTALFGLELKAIESFSLIKSYAMGNFGSHQAPFGPWLIAIFYTREPAIR